MARRRYCCCRSRCHEVSRALRIRPAAPTYGTVSYGTVGRNVKTAKEPEFDLCASTRGVRAAPAGAESHRRRRTPVAPVDGRTTVTVTNTISPRIIQGGMG